MKNNSTSNSGSSKYIKKISDQRPLDNDLSEALPEIYTDVKIVWGRHMEWDSLNGLTRQIDVGIKGIKKFNNSLEYLIKSNQNEIQEELDKLASSGYFTNIAKEEVGFHILVYHPHLMITTALEVQQRYGIVVSTFSFFESFLREISNLLERTFPKRLVLKDLSGNADLLNFRNFFTKVYEVDYSQVDCFHKALIDEKLARNKITHENGRMSENTQYKTKAPGIKIEDNKIVLEPYLYVEYLLSNIEGYFKEIIKAVDNRYKELVS